MVGRPRDERPRSRQWLRGKPRIAKLHRAGSSLEECARLAKVSYRFAQKWAARTKRSPRLDGAFAKLTGKSDEARPAA